VTNSTAEENSARSIGVSTIRGTYRIDNDLRLLFRMGCDAAERDGLIFHEINWMTALSLIQTLSPDQIEIVAAVYFDRKTQDQIARERRAAGKKTGITQPAVSQILAKAEMKLTKFGHKMPDLKAPEGRHTAQIDDDLMRSL